MHESSSGAGPQDPRPHRPALGGSAMNRNAALFLLSLFVLAFAITTWWEIAAADPRRSGPGISQFLGPDGQIDPEAIGSSSYQGSLDLSGYRGVFAPDGSLRFRPAMEQAYP